MLVDNNYNEIDSIGTTPDHATGMMRAHFPGYTDVRTSTSIIDFEAATAGAGKNRRKPNSILKKPASSKVKVSKPAPKKATLKKNVYSKVYHHTKVKAMIGKKPTKANLAVASELAKKKARKASADLDR